MYKPYLCLLIIIAIFQISAEVHASSENISEEQLNGLLREAKGIKDGMDAIFQRKVIVLESNNESKEYTKSPSQLLTEIIGLYDNNYNELLYGFVDYTYVETFLDFMDDVIERRTLEPEYKSFLGITYNEPSPLRYDIDVYKKAAKALDSLVILRIRGLNDDLSSSYSQRQKLLDTTYFTNKNTLKIRALKEKEENERREELFGSYRVSAQEYQLLLLGQSFRFSESADKLISVPLYISKTIENQLAKLQALFLNLSSNNKIDVVFDRYQTSHGYQLESNPKGWFNAIAQGNTLYISPSLARAAFVVCYKEAGYLYSVMDRIERFNLKYSLGDKVSILRSNITAVNSCLNDSLTFLLAHELAHGMLKIDSEEQADCVASSVTRHLGVKTFGVFQELIFNIASENRSLRAPGYLS